MLSDDARAEVAGGANKDELMRSIEEHLAGINPGLDHHEQLQFVAVTDDEWTPENGMLTPTMKLKRREVESRYGERMEGWYGAKKKVLWA